MKKKLFLVVTVLALLVCLLSMLASCGLFRLEFGNLGGMPGGITDGGTTDDDNGNTPSHTHTPGEWLVDQAPTCMKAGIRHRECTGCGETLSTEVMPVDKTAHNLTTTADDTYLYATCTEEGCTAAPSVTAHNMTFSVSGGKATLIKYKGSAASVVIPTTYNGYPVTSIGYEAFYNCSSLTSITIPNSVTSIGSSAFESCSSLTSITVDKNNTVYHSVGNCLIETKSKTLITGCNNSIIPSDGSVTSIGSYAFSECSSLTSITIPNSVTGIGSSAFYGCESLTSITIPNSVTSIGNNAFFSCSKLTSIHFNGTQAQWIAITKGFYWNGNTGAYTVYCTDGTISE